MTLPKLSMNFRSQLARSLRLGLPLLALLAACGAPEQPQGHRSGGITITGMWGTPGINGRVSAAYGTIANHGTEPDSLIAISSPAAPLIEVHQMVEQEGMLRMRGMKWPVVIAPGDSLAMAPGGTHLMLMELHQSLQLGDSVTLRLSFASAGQREVRFQIGNQQNKPQN